MHDVPLDGTDLPDDRLSRLRRDLRLQAQTRDWSDLLRHKAHALRTVAPGSSDPHDLARDLAAGGPPPAAPARQAHLARQGHLDGADLDLESLLRRARRIWETTADPDDEWSRQSLADAAEHVAGLLDQHGRGSDLAPDPEP